VVVGVRTVVVVAVLPLLRRAHEEEELRRERASHEVCVPVVPAQHQKIPDTKLKSVGTYVIIPCPTATVSNFP
jgi:hypothetical protein